MKYSKEMYPKIALIKSAYSFLDRAYVHLDSDELYYHVDLHAKPGQPDVSEDEFDNEMLCQCAKHAVYQQTKTLRELLVARAMASTVVQEPLMAEPDSKIPGVVGEEDAILAAEILRDWFDSDETAQA